MSVKNNFIQHLVKKYPQLSSEILNNLISDQLISPHRLTLPRSVLTRINQEIQQIYALRSWSENNLSSQFDKLNLPKAKNFSVCTSYDFHLNADQAPKLIEVNTNAAFLAMGLELYNFWNLNPATNFTVNNMVEMFCTESKLVGQGTPEIAILDERPQEQRLFVEFLLFQQIFLQAHIKCEIKDVSQVSELKPGTLIYNRYTDFYLKESRSLELKSLYTSGVLHLSPSPWEYFLLSDKQRLSDWQNQTEYPIPQSLLKIYDLASANKEQVWNERKKLFFKPKSSFGSKQAYNGSSMSSRIFEDAFLNGFIAQEYAPPAEIEVEQDNQKMRFKYDLRCYAYKDDLQLVVARLYQGQTTNLKTFGGGFAVVDFK